MVVSRALQLNNLGQSIWLDSLTRDLIRGGGLERMISEDGVCGITVNPTIFEQAVLGSSDYDKDIKQLAGDGFTALQIYQALLAADIRDAADLMRSTYEKTDRRDGYVSVEVAPRFARDPEGTIADALELIGRIERPNIMVKVPGTREGRHAVRELTMRGLNVNVTLLFSVDQYEGAARAYLDGLHDLHKAGGEASKPVSVASVFVSRIDAAVDRRIDELVKTASPEDEVILRSLRGEAAIATAKLCFRKFTELRSTLQWQHLAERGAHPQRLLWGSTRTKDPSYRDVKYVEALIGPDTVTTMPIVTLRAFNEHADVAPTLDETFHVAEDTLISLGKLGVNVAAIYDDLQIEGIEAFRRSYDSLIEAIDSKRRGLGSAA